MSDIEKKTAADLEWWQEVFGKHVVAWTFRRAASVDINNQRCAVGAEMRNFVANIIAERDASLAREAKLREALRVIACEHTGYDDDPWAFAFAALAETEPKA